MIGTQFNFHDLSKIEEIEEVVVRDTSPVIISAFGAPKGTEDMITISGTDFVKMYGQPDYKKYGQVSIQTRRLIDAGATIIAQRIVPDNATLANTIVRAKIYTTTAPKTITEGVDGEGNPIEKPVYIGDNGIETTEATNTEGEPNDPVTISTAHVMYDTISIPGIKSIDVITEASMEKSTELGNVEDITKAWDFTPAEGGSVTCTTYPLFAVTDNGRGSSNKRFVLTPENLLSKNLSFMYYTLDIIENGSTIDSITFTMLPDVVLKNECIDLNAVASSSLTMAKVSANEDNITEFISVLSAGSTISEADLAVNDFIFGTDRKGVAYSGIMVDTTKDLSASYGTELGSGVDGTFSSSSLTVEEEMTAYYNCIADFYNGKKTEDIYDIDSYQIDAAFDANFPPVVKEAILSLAMYRKDFQFFRDYGTKCKSVDVVINYRAENNLTQSEYATDYCQAYDVIDPYSKKQVKVTIMFSIAPMIVSLLEGDRSKPFAGQRNGAVITDIVPGTLNYKPRITPTRNDKDDLEDAKVNFGTYYSNTFVLETLYTSQQDYTQLSFLNNMLCVQQVVKRLRAKFPSIRYAFITGDEDIREYTTQANNAISDLARNFTELKFGYAGDSKYVNNKIYKAELSYRFGNFFQAEIIDAFALPTL